MLQSNHAVAGPGPATTRPAAFGLTLLIASGCAAFQGGDGPPRGAWPPPASGLKRKPTINVLVTGVGKDLFAHWQRGSTAAFTDSGLCADVKSSPEARTEMTARIDVKHTPGGTYLNPVMRFFSGFTFFLIPLDAYDQFEVEVEIRHPSKGFTRRYRKRGEAKLWVQTFLVLLAPVMTADKALTGVCYDLTSAAIVDAEKDGAFAAAGA